MSDDYDDGLCVALSPVQLAAIMQGRSIFLSETIGGRLTRAFGGLEMIGGAMELVGAGALFLAPEPTLTTKVGGAVLGANGADNLVAGAIQLWTGLPRTTLTQEAAAAAARALGCSPATADTVGIAVDVAVPLAIAAGWGAKASSTLSPRKRPAATPSPDTSARMRHSCAIALPRNHGSLVPAPSTA